MSGPIVGTLSSLIVEFAIYRTDVLAWLGSGARRSRWCWLLHRWNWVRVPDISVYPICLECVHTNRCSG